MSHELAIRIGFERLYQTLVVSNTNSRYYKMFHGHTHLYLKCLNRCFYTGILRPNAKEIICDTYEEFLECVKNNNYFKYKINVKSPFHLNRDHILCNRYWAGLYANPPSPIYTENLIFPAVSYLNKSMGHIPLELRLLHRRNFQSMDYDRDNPTMETLTYLKKKLIELEDRYLLDGRYPWHSHTYDDSNSIYKKQVDIFYSDTRKIEEYYASLSPEDRIKFIENHEVKWEV